MEYEKIIRELKEKYGNIGFEELYKKLREKVKNKFCFDIHRYEMFRDYLFVEETSGNKREEDERAVFCSYCGNYHLIKELKDLYKLEEDSLDEFLYEVPPLIYDDDKYKLVITPCGNIGELITKTELMCIVCGKDYRYCEHFDEPLELEDIRIEKVSVLVGRAILKFRLNHKEYRYETKAILKEDKLKFDSYEFEEYIKKLIKNVKDLGENVEILAFFEITKLKREKEFAEGIFIIKVKVHEKETFKTLEKLYIKGSFMFVKGRSLNKIPEESFTDYEFPSLSLEEIEEINFYIDSLKKFKFFVGECGCSGVSEKIFYLLEVKNWDNFEKVICVYKDREYASIEIIAECPFCNMFVLFYPEESIHEKIKNVKTELILNNDAFKLIKVHLPIDEAFPEGEEI